MSHCSNCNATLKQGARFCTNCGHPVHKTNIDKTETTRYDEPISKKANPKSSSKTLKIVLSIIAIVVLGFVVKSYITDLDVSRNSYSISKALTPLVGEWQAPVGSLLKDNEVMIEFRKRGDVLVGEDSAKRVYIQLFPYSSTDFNGLVVVDDIDGDYEVHFYKEEDKLVFFSTLTKTSWHIKKLKK